MAAARHFSLMALMTHNLGIVGHLNLQLLSIRVGLR